MTRDLVLGAAPARLGVALAPLMPGVTAAIRIGLHRDLTPEPGDMRYYRLVVSPSESHGWYLAEQEGEGEGGESPGTWRPVELSWVPSWLYAQDAMRDWTAEHMHQGATVVVAVKEAKKPKPKNAIKKVEFETGSVVREETSGGIRRA